MKTDKIYFGQYYHILNRGNQKQQIFINRDNYIYFLKRLKIGIQKYHSELICYCLMPNHFHFILKETIESSITKTMLSLQTSFAKSMNKRFNRIGHFFQDTYKFRLIESNEYLLHLSRYIHLNPAKAGLVEKPEEWEFSSYPDYIGIRNGRLPSTEIILSQFPDKSKYQDFVLDMINERDLGVLTLE